MPKFLKSSSKTSCPKNSCIDDIYIKKYFINLMEYLKLLSRIKIIQEPKKILNEPKHFIIIINDENPHIIIDIYPIIKR
jgi:hypothetical protein